MLRVRRWLVHALLLSLAPILAGVILCEITLRVPAQFRLGPSAAAAKELASAMDAVWEDAAIRAGDRIRLEAWFFQPRTWNGRAVILLHGIGNRREGMRHHAALFLRNGYAVLVPDSRGHGASGGPLISFGIRETDDLRRWLAWLDSSKNIRNVYALGQSMGAAILLQTLPAEPRIRAAVAESSFRTFPDIAYDRLAGRVHLGSAGGRILFWPIIEPGLHWARLRYSLDLRGVSPLEAVRRNSTPLLLIHGSEDRNIPPWHSRALYEANPAAAVLWEVPGAGHVTVLFEHPQEYERRVVSWFESHP